MANLTSIGLTAGAGSSGTGTISTLDNLIGTAGTASAQVLSVQGIASGTAQPVSAASLPLPTGASTSAKQPALGTAGTASTDVITVQGIASGTVIPTSLASTTITGTVAVTESGTWTVQPGNTPNTTAWKVDGSAVTQPVSGTVTINAIPAGSNTIGSVKLTDGTNTAAVKAASTTPVATDPAAVVSLSPNSVGLISLGQTTSSASVPVTPASDWVPSQPAGYTYKNISTAATTTVKSGAGVLHTITINSLGTVASTISVYDNTAGSGTSIAVLNSLTTGQATYIYDVAFATGLTLVTTGTVAPNVTVSYR
jgi:hypothetical protein